MPQRSLRSRWATAASVLAVTVALATPIHSAGATPASAVRDYCAGRCHDILPPGEAGNATLAEILLNRAAGTQPAHADDQLGSYADLVHGYPGLTEAELGGFFNDASFGVPDDQVGSSVKPRSDVTIVRDKKAGIPHVYGTTRSGTEFGAGYAAAQDRLWVMDLFRHVGRGELTSFAGGAKANRALEQDFWRAVPYTEAELRRQIDAIAGQGPRGRQALQDARSYLEGINAYIDQSHQGRYFPGEYVLTGKIDAITNVGEIEPFKLTDLVALASVVGGLFGTGGGGEVESALVKQAAEAKFGKAEGTKVWTSFRESNDPEAVQTLHDGQSFPYTEQPADPRGTAMPDPGSVTAEPIVYDPTGSGQDGNETRRAPVRAPARLKPLQGMYDDGVLPGDLLSAKHGMSNALVVSGDHADGGHPVAVFGPQTGYFAPQLLMLQELQGPGISARGASFAGVSFYVQLGRGADYAWSATSAGQDITDTYAVPLCTTDGSPVTKDATAYLFHGVCTPMERLEKKNAWKPTLADSTAEGSYRLVVYRTKYGLVTSRGTIGGKFVAFTSLRSTYRHEVDSIIGFQMLNDPGYTRSAQTFQQAAQHINYAFNWFYADDKDTAYYNSGSNPVRAEGVDPGLPLTAAPRYEWRDFDPATNAARYTPPAEHPQSVNQDYYISWNNKQADDYASVAFGEGSVHRANLLDSRVRKLIDSGRKVTRVSLTQAMAEAAQSDLRGEDVLPELLRVIRSRPVTDPDLARTVESLENWYQRGHLRKETAPGSHAYADTDAIRTFDAWWPLLAQAQFEPVLGEELFAALATAAQINESPSGGQTGPGGAHGGANQAVAHRGSAYQHGWWSYVDKDLRAVLGDPVKGALAREFCGGGDLEQCRQALLTSLKRAAAQPATEVYPGDDDCAAGDQWCADSIIHRPLGGLTHGKVHWQNRPTYQQVVQFQAHR